MSWERIRRDKIKKILENSEIIAVLKWKFDPLIDGITYCDVQVSKKEVINRLAEKETVCFREAENKYTIMDRWVAIFCYEVVVLDDAKSNC